jgi:BolA protein
MGLETRIDRIRDLLVKNLEPTSLLVLDDSNSHAGHSGSSPSGETHFKVQIKSPRFLGLTLVEQHRLIYSTLAHELKNGLHALEIESSESES